MRLIDVDLFIDMLEKEPMEKRTYYRANVIAANMPTAYDIDKVVEQLRKNNDVEKSRSAQYDEEGRLNLMDVHDAKAEAYRESIRIVKSGGIE